MTASRHDRAARVEREDRLAGQRVADPEHVGQPGHDRRAPGRRDDQRGHERAERHVADAAEDDVVAGPAEDPRHDALDDPDRPELVHSIAAIASTSRYGELRRVPRISACTSPWTSSGR
jgi:hypothetical protein